MQQHSTEKLQRDLAGLEKALAVPNLPADERAMHEPLAARIRAELASRQKAPTSTEMTPGGYPIPTSPPSPTRPQAKSTPAPKPTPPSPVSPPSRTQPLPPPTSPSHLGEGLGVGSIHADLNTATPTVTITWADDTAHTLTEGQARSRFTSTLRDLVNNRNAQRDGRLDDLRLTTTFSRARGYYAALTAFWKRPPTMKDLEIDARNTLRATIFQMITTTDTPVIHQ